MTIISVMWESETSILFGADSCLSDTETGLRNTNFNKIHLHPSAPLIWASAGNSNIGDGWFSSFFSQIPWPPQNLYEFQIQTAAILAQLNGKQREISQMARQNISSDFLTDILVAGYAEKPFVFSVDDKGIISECPFHDRFIAIGSGKTIAQTAYEVSLDIGAFASDEKKFIYIMEKVAKISNLCSLPVNVYRIAKNSVYEIKPA